jgi:hypothetical protein
MPDDKADLADIVYTHRRQGQETSETEINRIAPQLLVARLPGAWPAERASSTATPRRRQSLQLDVVLILL